MYFKRKKIHTNFFLKGGTAPGFWGAVGLPGARGRPGGKIYL